MRRLILILFLISAFLLGISIGSVKTSPYDLIRYLETGKDVKGYIVWEVRFPRTLGAMIGGMCLAISGLLLQTYFRNPLAGPYVLGISSASSLAVALYVLAGVGIHDLGIVGSAFLGSLLATILIIALAGKVRSAVTLLIAGLMLGYIFSAFERILITLAESRKVYRFILWTFGSFSGITWNNVGTMYAIGVPTLIFAFLLSKPLNALLLGEDYARSMGVNVKVIRVLVVAIASLLASVVTAFAGIVAFIGLAIPHMARLILKTSDHRTLIPATALLGGGVTVLCDVVARMLLNPVELPVSVVTSLFGAPIVIYLVMKRRRV